MSVDYSPEHCKKPYYWGGEDYDKVALRLKTYIVFGKTKGVPILKL